MRLLYLGIHSPDRSPSQRYRFESFREHLSLRGIETEYAWALDENDARVFYGKTSAVAKAQVAARALSRRVWSIAPRIGRPKFDVVLVPRAAFFLGPAWAEWAASLQAPMVVDFDDAIWLRDVSESNRHFGFLKNVAKVSAIISMAHTVLAGNAYLAAYARQFSKNVHVFPTVVDTEKYVPGGAQKPSGAPVVIGWSGSFSTIVHLRHALPALRRVKARYRARVAFRVVGDSTFEDRQLAVRGEAWTSAKELEVLQSMDIGIMPLPDDQWTRGKCGLKGLLYMAVGIPAVMSPVGVNSEIVESGKSGLLPATEDEWVEALSSLVESAELRRSLGRAGRVRAEEKYSVGAWKDRFAALIENAASAGPTRGHR